MQKVLVLFALMMLASCGGKEELPDVRSSVGLSMNGSRNITLTGAVNEISQTKELDLAISPEGWATAPVPLLKPLGFAIAARSGKVMIYDERDSVRHTVSLGDSVIVDQLLTTGNRIIAVCLNGGIYSMDSTGKITWQNAAPEQLTANVILTSDRIYLPCSKTLYIFNARTGAFETSIVYSLYLHSLAYSASRSSLVIAATHNSSGAQDSLFILSSDGKQTHAYGLPETRFTSNIAMIGEDEDRIAFGFLGSVGGPQRTSAVALMKGSFDGNLEREWVHAVPYVIGNVGANDIDVIVGGIREQGELTSGLDAFRIDDTVTTWSRRFSEPLVAPFGVSKNNVYLHLSFSSDAIVETRGIFYTIDAETGRTYRHQSIPGAEEGFLPHIPMPDAQGRFLLADRTRLIVYLLDRSSFERVFK